MIRLLSLNRRFARFMGTLFLPHKPLMMAENQPRSVRFLNGFGKNWHQRENRQPKNARPRKNQSRHGLSGIPCRRSPLPFLQISKRPEIHSSSFFSISRIAASRLRLNFWEQAKRSLPFLRRIHPTASSYTVSLERIFQRWC